MIQLRPYQDRAVAELRAAYLRGRRAPLLVAPTGSGKTIVAAHIIQSAHALGNRSLFVAPRRELIGQTVRKLADAGVHDVRVIQAATDSGRSDAPVIVGSIQTLILPRWHGRLPPADLVIADEAHHMAAAQYRKLADAYPRARWLGLTATPERADGRPLGDIFDELIVAASVSELMELHDADPMQGLVRYKWVEPVGGELASGELALDPVTAYQQHASGELAVAFCVSVEHAETTAAEFTTSGISAAVVHGDTPSRRRDQTLCRWADGEIRVVANCGVLTEGFDLPALSACILARKFGHAGLFLQCVGRVLRPWPGKERATVLDLPGNWRKHQLPDTPREYSLDGKAIRPTIERDAIRQCQKCGAVFPAGGTGCPSCGGELPRQPIAAPRVLGVGLVEVTPDAVPVRTPRAHRGQEIVAAYASRCMRCAGPIRPGQQIWWSRGDGRSGSTSWHVACGAAAGAGARA